MLMSVPNSSESVRTAEYVSTLSEVIRVSVQQGGRDKTAHKVRIFLKLNECPADLSTRPWRMDLSLLSYERIGIGLRPCRVILEIEV